jgi:hypothetical protein
VSDHVAVEAGEDRCQGHQSWPLRHLPDGRGDCAGRLIRENPAADRCAATTGYRGRLDQEESAGDKGRRVSGQGGVSPIRAATGASLAEKASPRAKMPCMDLPIRAVRLWSETTLTAI